MNYDLIVIGSGPGGYVAAIRASQLGMNVAVVERAELGGNCLNWGCIPTKSLLKSAQVLEYARHAADYGVKVEAAEPDFAAVVARSRAVADKMSKGIQYLFKKNNITVIPGTGKLTADKKVEVTNGEGEKTLLEATHVILATGARSRQLPNIPQDGRRAPAAVRSDTQSPLRIPILRPGAGIFVHGEFPCGMSGAAVGSLSERQPVRLPAVPPVGCRKDGPKSLPVVGAGRRYRFLRKVVPVPDPA